MTIDANSIAKIAWSDTLNGTKRAVGSTVTLPTALNVPNTTLIWSEVSYNYTPTIGYVVTGTLESVRSDLHAAAALGHGHPRQFLTNATACLRPSPRDFSSGIGSAVVALIFSMAKREVTFLSGTEAISRL